MEFSSILFNPIFKNKRENNKNQTNCQKKITFFERLLSHYNLAAMWTNSEFGGDFSLAKRTVQCLGFYLDSVPVDVFLQLGMNIIIPAAVRRRTFILRGHIVGPKKRFIALRAVNF